MTSQVPWWKGKRGEWYVVTQVVLMILVFFGPRTWTALPEPTQPWQTANSILGGVLLLIGIVFLAAGVIKLGANLTAVPFPKEQSSLVRTGPYQLVRHPMYSGGVLIAFGWAILIQGWLTIVYAFVLLAFFDCKSRREEQWLNAKFPEYVSYQEHVRKLIPFIY